MQTSDTPTTRRHSSTTSARPCCRSAGGRPITVNENGSCHLYLHPAYIRPASLAKRLNPPFSNGPNEYDTTIPSIIAIQRGVEPGLDVNRKVGPSVDVLAVAIEVGVLGMEGVVHFVNSENVSNGRTARLKVPLCDFDNLSALSMNSLSADVQIANTRMYSSRFLGNVA